MTTPVPAAWHDFGRPRAVQHGVATCKQQTLQLYTVNHSKNRRHLVDAQPIARNFSRKFQRLQPAIHEARKMGVIGGTKTALFQIMHIKNVDLVQPKPRQTELERPHDRVVRAVKIDCERQRTHKAVVGHLIHAAKAKHSIEVGRPIAMMSRKGATIR